MNWTEQAETMTKVWADAQKKMWENWYELSQTAPPPLPAYGDMAKQWREMTTQSFEMWAANAEPTAKEISRRLFASQEAFVRFLKLSAEAWQKIAEKVASGEEWQTVLTEYTNQIRREMLEFPEKIQKNAKNIGELWQLYLTELQKSAQPWMQVWQQANGHVGQAIAGDGSAFAQVMKHYKDAYDHTFGHLLESPTLGYSRELNEKILRGFDTWQDLHQANGQYQILVTEAWVKAFEQFQRELVALAEKGEAITSLEQLVNQWYNVADESFIEVFRSEAYIRAQGQLLSASLNFRIIQREIVELFLKINDLPTRTEVDQAHRNIYEQRKEIKALKKMVAQLSDAQQQASTQTELQKAQQTITGLQAEVNTLKETLAEVSAQAGQVTILQAEIKGLKAAVEKPAKLKPSTTRKASKQSEGA